jgi:hypothetical protein
MNERIRKLAERAGFSYMPSNYPDMADLYECADFELEKFAELIVRECAYIADKAEPYKANDLIKQHFGVEL